MPGQVKVGGSWRSAPGLFVKVSGSWRSATSAWVKVGGVWKQWFIGKITDTFTRTTTTNLGSTDTGVAWTTSFGSWLANGSVANSTSSVSAGNAGAVAYVPLASADATVSSTVTPGTGPAFWVTAAGSWWGAISYSDTSSYSYSCNCTYSCNNCTTYTCTNCSTTTTYTGTPTASCTGPTVSCSDTTNTCNPGGCGSVSSSTSTTYSCPNSSYPYYSGGNCWDTPSHNGQSIQATATNTYTRTQNTTVTTYTCNSGDTGGGSSSTCTHVAITSGGTYPSCSCGVTTSTVSGGTYPSCACGSTSSCQTCTGTATNYYARVIYSTSTGAPYTVYSTTAATAQVQSIQVVTLGTGATVTGYSDTALTTSVVSATVTGAATTGTNHGIVKAYSANAQGTTVDNFSAGV